MTEARLKELQEINGCKNALQHILDHIDDKEVEVAISVECYDMTYTTMYAQLHHEFFADFRRFLIQQRDKYKEAFDNA